MADTVDVTALRKTLCQFDGERDWQQFHSLKNLAISVSCEASELLELFQWLSDEEATDISNDSKRKQSISHEIADIIMYILRIADKLDLNVSQAINEKITINQKRYPPHLVKGCAKKHTRY